LLLTRTIEQKALWVIPMDDKLWKRAGAAMVRGIPDDLVQEEGVDAGG
jgi:hypothetical protein